MTKYIFITGGVVSSLGKGIAASSLAALLQARNYKVRLRKLDPYLNVDPGTMSPYQHGEVFVTDDGAETDLDFGHYERFINQSTSKNDSTTTGKIYRNIIERERRGDYLGATVQIIPHVTNEIKKFILNDNQDFDFVICEIGGTVGDIEAMPFLEAIRQLRNDLSLHSILYIHLTLMPYIASAGEAKTKPTQHSVKALQSLGISPDILLIRTDRSISESDRKKLSLFCNVRFSSVIPAYDVSSIYDVPLAYHKEGFDLEVLKNFGIDNIPELDIKKWEEISDLIHNPRDEVNIAIVGKYVVLKDAYKSLIEALIHGGLAHCLKVNIHWIDAEILEKDVESSLKNIDGILVPGAFGTRGSEGKMEAIRYARENEIPFFGICFGMQLTCIEAAKNLLHLPKSSSTEFGPCEEPVVALMTEWMKGDDLEKRLAKGNLGGTMRLGSYEAHLEKNSKIANIYNQEIIFERHRHRYEVNMDYRDRLESVGLHFSGFSPDGLLPESVEYKNHPWFIAVQYHPELKSRPFQPHPLFVSFIEASLVYKNSKNI